jgi:hypothetical protein
MLRTIALSLLFLFVSFKSFAGDYKVDYAIDMRGVVEIEEAAECSYGRSCMLEFKETHMSIFLIADVRSWNRRFSVSIYGKGIWCCYFNDGDNTIKFEYNRFDKYKKLDIFVGRQRQGNEYISNIKEGTLFLMFKDFH